jgi:hypothetical protein
MVSTLEKKSQVIRVYKKRRKKGIKGREWKGK